MIRFPTRLKNHDKKWPITGVSYRLESNRIKMILKKALAYPLQHPVWNLFRAGNSWSNYLMVVYLTKMHFKKKQNLRSSAPQKWQTQYYLEAKYYTSLGSLYFGDVHTRDSRRIFYHPYKTAIGQTNQKVSNQLMFGFMYQSEIDVRILRNLVIFFNTLHCEGLSCVYDVLAIM